MANSPTSLPIRRTNDLSIGRRSTPGAAYFITLCESHRRASLIREPIADEIKRSLDALHASGDIELIAAVVMLDHIHLLGVLGHRLSLGRLMGRFKARTHNVLRPLGFEWQENFYEHHLRADDDLEPFARYIFLHPYRANLFRLTAQWPLWWRWGDIRFEFEARVAQTGTVPSAWLGEPDPVGAADL